MIVATVNRERKRLSRLKRPQPTFNVGQDLELRAIPKINGAPVSIRSLYQAQVTWAKHDTKTMRTVPNTRVLAIREERKDGSATNTRTGSVVYQGKLESL